MQVEKSKTVPKTNGKAKTKKPVEIEIQETPPVKRLGRPKQTFLERLDSLLEKNQKIATKLNRLLCGSEIAPQAQVLCVAATALAEASETLPEDYAPVRGTGQLAIGDRVMLAAKARPAYAMLGAAAEAPMTVVLQVGYRVRVRTSDGDTVVLSRGHVKGV